eukprot:3575557-Pyramimonas_sp.AAC.1
MCIRDSFWKTTTGTTGKSPRLGARLVARRWRWRPWPGWASSGTASFLTSDRQHGGEGCLTRSACRIRGSVGVDNLKIASDVRARELSCRATPFDTSYEYTLAV